jgi:methylmalonyl-CoA mutase, C-terminal domain
MPSEQQADGPPRATPPIRVLLAKPGLDGHFRGVATVGAALRNAGMEVIYTGPRQTPEQIAAAAIAEDVDLVGLNVMTLSAARVVERLREALAARGAEEAFPIVIGGIIKPSDAQWLREHGVDGIFGPGTPMTQIVQFVRELVAGGSDGA